MKIAISASGATWDSALDLRFGRAQTFVLIDSETGELTGMDNQQNYQAAQGAGIQAAQQVVNSGAEAVITGNVGPKAFRALQAGEVAIYLCKDMTVKQAYELYQQGKLEKVDNANVDGHWM